MAGEKKNAIVICCDGTRNSFGKPDTNVRRIFDALDDETYYRYYDTGLGTDSIWRDTTISGSALDRASNLLANARGAAFAMGQHRKVLDAYRFLCNCYGPALNIYLFGFSRGAWCVRRLAKMVAAVGLLPRDSDHLVPIAYDAYNAFKKMEEGEQQGIPLYESMCRLTAHRRPDCIFIGVWDTVRSEGLRTNKESCSLVKVNETQEACGVAATKESELVGRHALALDDRRFRYEPELWNNDSRVRQRWFPGDHCDVGGGNLGEPAGKGSRDDVVTEESDLSYLSLMWLCKKAKKCGLDFDIDAFKKAERVVRAQLWSKRRGVSDKSTMLWPPWNIRLTSIRKTRRLISPEYETDCDCSVQARLDTMVRTDAELYIQRKDPEQRLLKLRQDL